MTKAPKRHRWVCEGEHPGVLAPGRMRRNDVRRFCWPCSMEAGVLVERTCPTLERKREHRAMTKAERDKRERAIARERAAEAAAVLDNVNGFSLRKFTAWVMRTIREQRRSTVRARSKARLTVARGQPILMPANVSIPDVRVYPAEAAYAVLTGCCEHVTWRSGDLRDRVLDRIPGWCIRHGRLSPVLPGTHDDPETVHHLLVLLAPADSEWAQVAGDYLQDRGVDQLTAWEISDFVKRRRRSPGMNRAARG